MPSTIYGCTNNLGHLSTDNNLNNTKISNFFDFRIELKLCVQSMKESMWEMCRDNSFIWFMRDAGEEAADNISIVFKDIRISFLARSR